MPFCKKKYRIWNHIPVIEAPHIFAQVVDMPFMFFLLLIQMLLQERHFAMDSLQATTSTDEGARIFPKLTSRRKRSRPVKFNQDLDDVTESGNYFDNNSADLTHDNSSGNELSKPPASGDEQTADFILGAEDISPASSTGMIHRSVTSIRDTSLLKTGSMKRLKLEEDSSPEVEASHSELDTQSANQQEPETTFSSLLHNFASQVHSRIEQPEQQSPYPVKSPVSDAIWSMPSVSSSVVTNTNPRLQNEIVNQDKKAIDRSKLDLQNDVSFSGLLQNFVSCVNDSPPKDSSAPAESLLSLLKKGQTKNKSENNPIKSPSEKVLYSSSRLAPVKEEQKSFAGLLYSFASVVDKSQGPSHDSGHDNVSNFQKSGIGKEPQGKGAISLLDVLHDTISRQILESAPSSSSRQILASAPSSSKDDCRHLNSSEKLLSYSQSTHVYSTSDDDRVLCKFSNVQDSPENLRITKTLKIEQEDDLPPNGQQWSHIQNVLPPLDTEEDPIHEQHHSSLVSHLPENPTDESWLHKGQHHSLLTTHVKMIKQEPVGEDSEQGGMSCSPEGQKLTVEIKTEPADYPTCSAHDANNQTIASTLRERLLSRIESRHSLHTLSAVPSKTAASSKQYTESKSEEGLEHPDGNESFEIDQSHGKENIMTNRGGLVSHIQTSADTSHWKNRQGGSFADLLHNITSSMLEKEVKDCGSQREELEQHVIKQEQVFSEGKPNICVQKYVSAAGDNCSSSSSSSSSSISGLLEAKQSGIPEKKKIPRCIARLLGEPAQSTISTHLHASDTHEVRAERMKVVSYADVSSAPSSPSSCSEEIEQKSVDPKPNNNSKPYRSLSPRSKNIALMKQRWKRNQKHSLKLKQGWPKNKRLEVRSLQLCQPGVVGRNLNFTQDPQPQATDSKTTSFTDILQKLAQKCQAGNQEAQHDGYNANRQQNPNTLASVMQQQFILGSQPSTSREGLSPTVLSRLSEPASSANLRNLIEQGSASQLHEDADSNSGTPSSSVQSRDVSFSNLMQNMASTVTKKKSHTSQSSYEDLMTLDPPSPWIKSISGNWLRFLIISPDENPRVTISVSVNLWNSIHEVKIHCHHLEVPVNHWIFRRFGKRIHTKAALSGVLQAICNGCSVCEGTTRSDLVRMYRNKLASTSRWQAAAVMEDSFGPAAVRSRQCELLVSGLRRSREKRCSKCSKFVDRKLKAVMYHMCKKLGLS